MRRLAPALLLATLMTVGCAPSLRMVHQSNAYFERCHAADFDPTVTPELRRQCWARWLQHYTYGQPPDRVEYARSRVAALEDGEEIEPLPGMQRAAVDGSYTASFLTTRDAEVTPAQPDEGPDDTEGNASDATQGGATTAGEEEAGRTPVWDRQGQRLDPSARRVIEPERELPEPPETRGACARVCTPRWNDCISRCDERPDSCREACETEHRTCMRGCF